jgi:methionyl-tRNA formyltransferase
MRYVAYLKGERGAGILKGLEGERLIPTACVSEKPDEIVRTFCARFKIPYILEDRPRRKGHIERILRYRPDLIVCAGYSRILPERLFRDLKYGAINCHGGRLPQYRGASPIPWQIIRSETYGFAYVLKMTKGIDDGPILAKARYDITPDETARDVTDKVVDIFRRIVPMVVKSYASGRPPREIPQPTKGRCRWTRRKPEDGLINFGELTVKETIDLIRALDDPYPGAFVVCKEKRYVACHARIYPIKIAGIPGRVVGRTTKGILILAKDGAVEITEFKKGKTIIDGRDLPVKYGDDL